MSDSDSSYDDDDVPVTFQLHNAAESGDVAALERMLGLSEDAEMAGDMAALFRRLADMMDSNGSTPLHLAIINGHAPCASALLRAGASVSKACDGNPPLALAACLALSADDGRVAAAKDCTRALLAAGADPYDRDDGGRTALHWAAASGSMELVSVLLEGAAASQRSRVEGVVEDAVEAAGAAAAAAVADGGAELPGGVKVVLPPGTAPEHILTVADADGLTPLHLAAKFGHAALVAHLLEAATKSTAVAAAAAAALAKEAAALAATTAKPREAAGAAAAAAAESGEPAAAAPPPPASSVIPPSASAIQDLLPATDAAKLLHANKARQGHTPLHLAATYGRAAAVAALLVAAGGSAAALAAAADRKGRTPADLARRRGHEALAANLENAARGGAPEAPQPEEAAAAGPGARTPTGTHTLLLAPEDCLLHRTAPEPIVRSGPEPPPENVNRLHVLTRSGSGILHNAEFAEVLHWRTTGIPQAAMVDVLKCHEWSYVRGVIQACEAIADEPSAVGSLDADTAISRHTMRAALAAAGAVCAAVDEVVTGKARNAFCAVRPPGHHAGPTGVVTNPNETHGSHGFCLLSNVAIGAAYAMAMHRGAGIRRVAILDFDVHHGNGTQACVLNTAPSVRTIPIRTPYSEGLQRFPIYKPWLGDGDLHNIFFASVQGFGRRSSMSWFYPGSGSTADSAIAETLKPAGGAAQPPADASAAAPAAASPSAPPAATAASSPSSSSAPSPSGSGAPQVPEDPDGEFRGGYDVTVVGGPRVINVGIPGPGGKPRMWRRAWRDKILPALVNFRPDIILVSAGFDAHKKEDLNLRYVGVTESDYEWLTDQIVEVANACCGGRVVSVLEGGYNLRGGPLGSAFARSVAAHVRALAAPSAARYDPSDAASERAAEKAVEAKKAARASALAAGLSTPRSAAPTPRGLPPAAAAAAAGVAAAAAAAAADTAATAAAAAAAAAAATAAAAAAEGPTPMDTDRPPESAGGAAAAEPGSAGGAAADGTAGDDSGPPSKRRRRPVVDYAALNAQLEREREEAAAATAASPAVAGAPGGGAGNP